MPGSHEFRGGAALTGPSAESLFALNAGAIAEREAAESAQRARALADDTALWTIADTACPDDIRQFAKRHGIPHMSELLWVTAFMAGWRAAHRASIERNSRVAE